MFWKTKKTANKAAAINALPECNPRTREVVDIKGALSAEDIRKVVDTFHHSPIVHALLQIEHSTRTNMPVQEWEIELAKKTFEDFLAKHDSPLAKALK